MRDEEFNAGKFVGALVGAFAAAVLLGKAEKSTGTKKAVLMTAGAVATVPMFAQLVQDSARDLKRIRNAS